MDDTAKELLYILARMHQGPQGLAHQLMTEVQPGVDRADRFAARKLHRQRIAAECETTPEEVANWELGVTFPNPNQALKWLRYLYDASGPVRVSPMGARLASSPPKASQDGRKRPGIRGR
jgi:hypothetical protein